MDHKAASGKKKSRTWYTDQGSIQCSDRATLAERRSQKKKVQLGAWPGGPGCRGGCALVAVFVACFCWLVYETSS